MNHILIVEDDLRLSRGVAFSLEADGHVTVSAANAAEAYSCLDKQRFDLAVLDVNLPGEDGFEICRTIRKLYPDMAIIFLTARDLDVDQENGFNLGADDYITKPFNTSLLRKRVNAVLRRYKQDSHDLFTDGTLTIDFDSMQASLLGKALTLTPTEYRLLKLFIDHADKVLTRQALLADVWDRDENYVDEHTLTVNINRLRGKLNKDGTNYIKTVYGMGYMWTGGKGNE